MCCRIEKRLRRRAQLPAAWSDLPTLDGVASIGEVVDVVGALGDRSDEILRSLLASQHNGVARVAEVVVVAAHPLLHRRCAGNPALSADGLATELAMVVGSMMRDGLPATSRRVLNVLVDKAWGRYRLPFRRVRVRHVDVERVACRLEVGGPLPEDVLDRVALLNFRQWLAAAPVSNRAFVRCWNSAVELALLETRTPVQRDRWKYVRSQLRRVAPPELTR